MKKLFNKIQNKMNGLAIRAKTTIENVKAEGCIYADLAGVFHPFFLTFSLAAL